MPHFVLYNLYRSVVRLYYWNSRPGQNYTHTLVSLSVTGDKSGVLTLSQAGDQAFLDASEDGMLFQMGNIEQYS